MTEEMRKKFDEAAEQAGIDAFNNAYDNLETGELCCLCQEIAVENHRAGTELGYKGAIEQTKKWMKTHLPCIHTREGDAIYVHGFRHIPMSQFLADFEADMNKLWEEKK